VTVEGTQRKASQAFGASVANARAPMPLSELSKVNTISLLVKAFDQIEWSRIRFEIGTCYKSSVFVCHELSSDHD
jgi:hypothetical protein